MPGQCSQSGRLSCVDLPQWLRDLTAEGWTAVIALVALLLTVGSSVSRWVGGRRAEVTVNVEVAQYVAFEKLKDQTRFVVENVGQRIARDVDVSFDLMPADSPKPMFGGSGRSAFPIPLLAPGHPAHIPVVFVARTATTFEIVVTWKDGRFRRQKRTVTISRAGRRA